MKRKVDREEAERFVAYDSYTYAYDHPEEQKRHKKYQEEQDEPDFEAAEWSQEEIPLTDAERQRRARERTQAHSRALTTRLIIVLAVLVVIIILLQKVVFSLTTVYIVGNDKIPAQQVAAASGLVKGLNMFAINEDEIKNNLDSDHNIVFLGMQKVYPSTIYLYIDEREAVASIQWLGLLYTLDDVGMVMDEANSTDLPQGMPSLTGMEISSINVGQTIEVRNQTQLNAYISIISELELQLYLDQVTEMNLSDTSDLFLQTASGISVRLGTAKYMRAKIGAIRTDLPFLQQLGKTSGVLDVSIPEDAKYSPDS